jgi:hypothetical protein
MIYLMMKCNISTGESHTMVIVIGQLGKTWQEIQLDIAVGDSTRFG